MSADEIKKERLYEVSVDLEPKNYTVEKINEIKKLLEREDIKNTKPKKKVKAADLTNYDVLNEAAARAERRCQVDIEALRGRGEIAMNKRISNGVETYFFKDKEKALLLSGKFYDYKLKHEFIDVAYEAAKAK